MTTASEQDPVDEAETEAVEAEQLVAALEERVRNGDESVRPEEIQAQESLGRFARLRVEAAKRKAKAEREKARQKGLQALRKEIEAYAGVNGDQLADLLRSVESSTAAFVHAVRDRNAQIVAWRWRMISLGVDPISAARLAPSAEHAHLAFGSNMHDATLQIGGRQIRRLVSGMFVQRALMRVASQPDVNPQDVFVDNAVGGEDHVYDDLEAYDVSGSEPSRDGYFYRGPGGAVIQRDKPYTEPEVSRLGLKRITAKEAFGE